MFIAIDQHGATYRLDGKHPRKALLEKLGATHASKMYVDLPDGKSQHIGYVVGGLWCRIYELRDWGKVGG
jgi:hypothetical protein